MNLSVIVPVGLLLAVVLTLGRMYHDSEMAALQACGFGPVAAAGAVVLFCRRDRRGLRPGWRSSRCRAPMARCSCCAIGDQGGAIRPAGCRAIPLLQRRRCRVLRRTRRSRTGFCTMCSCSASRRAESSWRLADTATYSKAAPAACTSSRCSTAAATRGCRGRDDFRIIEFREHGIPIATPADTVGGTSGSGHQAHARAVGHP
jgi:hypothetical protein